jgi:hypothetical protein
MTDNAVEKANAENNLTDEALSDCINKYKNALDALRDCQPNTGKEDLRKLVLQVLVDRDAVHKVLSDVSPVSLETINELIQLDERLKAEAQTIAQDDQLAEWRKSMNPPTEHWWWYLQYPLSLSLDQAIERYAKALDAFSDKSFWQAIDSWFTSGFKLNRRAAEDQAIEVLLARDAVETALADQSVPDRITKTIIKLDERLKRCGKEIARQNRLVRWKKSRSRFAEQWWWNLKPTAIGSPDEPQPWFDSLLNIATVGCLLGAGSFAASSFKAFSETGFGVPEIFTSGLQAALLAVATKGALTKDGRETIEKILVGMDAPPELQAKVTFAGSVLLLGLTYGINASLPYWGIYTYASGLEAEQTKWEEVQADYKNSLKFFSKNPRMESLIAVKMGKVYEAQNNPKEALKSYDDAKDKFPTNPVAFSSLGKMYVLQAFNTIDAKNSSIKKDSQNKFQDLLNDAQISFLKAEKYLNYWSRKEINEAAPDVQFSTQGIIDLSNIDLAKNRGIYYLVKTYESSLLISKNPSGQQKDEYLRTIKSHLDDSERYFAQSLQRIEDLKKKQEQVSAQLNGNFFDKLMYASQSFEDDENTIGCYQKLVKEYKQKVKEKLTGMGGNKKLPTLGATGVSQVQSQTDTCSESDLKNLSDVSLLQLINNLPLSNLIDNNVPIKDALKGKK